jgi:hypothetical protein
MTKNSLVFFAPWRLCVGIPFIPGTAIADRMCFAPKTVPVAVALDIE